MTNRRTAHAIRRRLAGFTLIEILVVIGVLALLASLAAPGMQRLVAAQRLRSAGYDLVADLTLARSEALKRAAPVELVPTAGSWAKGWIVQIPAGSALGQRGALDGLNIHALTPAAGVTFNASGRVSGSATVRFGFSDSYGRHRCVIVDPSGRPRSTSTQCTSSST